jgi:hypothetical protein
MIRLNLLKYYNNPIIKFSENTYLVILSDCEMINTITLENGETNPITRCALNLLHQMYYCIDLSYYLEKIMIRPECC